MKLNLKNVYGIVAGAGVNQLIVSIPSNIVHELTKDEDIKKRVRAVCATGALFSAISILIGNYVRKKGLSIEGKSQMLFGSYTLATSLIGLIYSIDKFTVPLTFRRMR